MIRNETKGSQRHVPFDPGNSVLLAQFSEYADECFALRVPALAKPESSCGSCQEYETYYQQVNLYYSFSRAMRAVSLRILPAKWGISSGFTSPFSRISAVPEMAVRGVFSS